MCSLYWPHNLSDKNLRNDSAFLSSWFPMRICNAFSNVIIISLYLLLCPYHLPQFRRESLPFHTKDRL